MRWLRGFFGAVAVLLLSGSVALSVLRNLDSGVRLFAMVSAFASYAVVGYLLTLLITGLLLRKSRRCRRSLWAGVVASVLGLVVQGVWLAPQFRGDGKAHHADLTLLTANLQYGEADPAVLVRDAIDQKVDVLVLEEVTYAEYAGLKRAGLRDLLPYVAGRPDHSAAGTMVFSTYPLTDPHAIDISTGAVAVEVGAPAPFRLIAAHPSQPVLATATWRRDLGVLRQSVSASLRQGPTIVAGDFNATLDHARFRAVLSPGLTDSVDSAGSGWQPTWPESLPQAKGSDRVSGAWLRPVIAIDHVLLGKQYAALSTKTLRLPGSDHRALLVQLDRL